MTISLHERGVGVVLLDIEGTTTPISFVYDVLFPYARAHMREVLADLRSGRELAEIEQLLREEHGVLATRTDGEIPPRWNDSSPEKRIETVHAFCTWLMDRDVKSPGLKLLQGLIWERGYANGTLKGEVFPDVPPALARWTGAGTAVAIYSSGSVLAQKLLFSHTDHGDLTKYLTAHFDTAVGGKKEPASYERIADHLGVAERTILFISDMEAELLAADAAGMSTLMSVRPGNPEGEGKYGGERVGSFEVVHA